MTGQPFPRLEEHGAVLAGVKAKPFGWPAASLDTGCGRHPTAPVGGRPEGTSKSQDPTNQSLYGIRGLPDPRVGGVH